jgi:hypothetical protein
MAIERIFIVGFVNVVLICQLLCWYSRKGPASNQRLNGWLAEFVPSAAHLPDLLMTPTSYAFGWHKALIFLLVPESWMSATRRQWRLEWQWDFRGLIRSQTFWCFSHEGRFVARHNANTNSICSRFAVCGMRRASSEGLGLFLLCYVRGSHRVQCISAERNVLSDKLP